MSESVIYRGTSHLIHSKVNQNEIEFEFETHDVKFPVMIIRHGYLLFVSYFHILGIAEQLEKMFTKFGKYSLYCNDCSLV